MAFLRRWGGAEDAAFKSRIVTGELLGGGYDAATLTRSAKHFAERQQSRMPLVGCVGGNETLIETSFDHLMKIMDRVHESASFLFGGSPTLADFGLYGHLQSLATDPTPWAEMRRECMGAFPYLQLLEDASGVEPTALQLHDIGSPAIALSQLAADLYLQYLKQNAIALDHGNETFSFHWRDLSCTQRPFKYHSKCLRLLRDEFRALPAGSKSSVTDILGNVDALEAA